MNTTEAPTAPGISSLDKRQQLNIAVAVATGYTWALEGLFWRLYMPPEKSHHVPRHVFTVKRKGEAIDFGLPDYAGDPATWGALIRAHGVDLLWNSEGTQVTAYATSTDGYVRPTDEVGVAVCCAVLAKAGVDPTPYI